MSALAKNLRLTLPLLTAVGAIIGINKLSTPSKTQSMANAMRRQLDEYNTNVEQDRS